MSVRKLLYRSCFILNLIFWLKVECKVVRDIPFELDIHRVCSFLPKIIRNSDLNGLVDILLDSLNLSNFSLDPVEREECFVIVNSYLDSFIVGINHLR